MTDFAIPREALILAEETGKVIEAIKDVKIVDATMYAAAGERLKELSTAEKRIEDMRKSLKAPILAAGKAIDAFFGAPLDRINAARNSVKRSLLTYQQDEERKRREIEARAQEEARKQAEKLQRQAEAAAAKGKAEKAEALQAAAASVIVPIIPPTTQKLVGISNRETWHFEITDFSKLPREWTMPDDKKLGSYVRAMKSETDIPGVRVFSKDGLAG